MGDRLGKGIDEGIKETVVTFNLLGLNTTASCEGHPGREKRAVPSPWVDVEATNKPETRWVDEEQIWESTAKKYAVSVEDVKTWKTRKISLEAFNEMEKKGETKEFGKWLKQTRLLRQKLQKYLDEFYKDRQALPEFKLCVSPFDVATFRVEGGRLIYFGPKKNWDYPKNKDEEKAWDSILKKRQTEMTAFTDFLKNKYFQS